MINVPLILIHFQIDFLNSVIVDMQRKNEELKSKLELYESGAVNGEANQSLE